MIKLFSYLLIYNYRGQRYKLILNLQTLSKFLCFQLLIIAQDERCQGTVLWRAVIRRFAITLISPVAKRQIYKKEIIQTNNSAKNEKIQRNNSPKFEKIQRNILKVRIITRFKSLGLEEAFEEEVGVDGDLVVAMLSDGARHAASGNDVGFAV